MGGHGKEIPERQIKLGALGFPAHGYRGLGASPAVWIKVKNPRVPGVRKEENEGTGWAGVGGD